MKSSVVVLALGAASVYAQRPSNTSICDYYANALLGGNNATTQGALLTVLVNTAVIGNYTTPNQNAVPGILSPDAMYNGTKVNLAKYFDGSLKSTNTGKSQGEAVNFLDGGGAKPLEADKAGKHGSHQYTLLTHLYSYFGLLLGCSEFANTTAPYKGETSMYDVHKYMALDAYEVQYFITQVGLSAASFGVAAEDIETVGHALQDLFGSKCAPEMSIVPAWKTELQSICIADDCPTSPNATCSAYDKVEKPSSASGSSTGSGSAMPSASGTGSAAGLGVSLALGLSGLGFIAAFLM